MTNLKSVQLLQLDQRMRPGGYATVGYLNIWERLEAIEVNKHQARSKSTSTMGLYSFHPNGFVRLAAIQQMESVKDGSEIPFLLMRLSDWVPQVQNAAERAVDVRINDHSMPFFACNLALISSIRKRERISAEKRKLERVEKIEDLLMRSENRNVLLNVLSHGTTENRLACLRIVEASHPQQLEDIIETVLRHHKDFYSRQMVLQLSSQLLLPSRIKTARFLLADRSARIRLESLRFLASNLLDDSTELLIKALIDKSPSVRLFARWQLKEYKSELDFKQFYLDLLRSSTNQDQLSAAVMGLCEVGTADDASALVQLFGQSNNHVRKSIIMALGKLNAKAHASLFIRELQSEIPGVSRTAAEILCKSSVDCETSKLWQIYKQTNHSHVKSNVARVFNQASIWDRLIYLLSIFSDKDDAAKKISYSGLVNWQREFGSTWAYTPLTNDQKLMVKALRVKLPENLPRNLRELIDECAKS